MIKLVNFKNWNLDCYGKSIKDFINFLRDDILEQIRNCKNNKNYENYKSFFNDLEEKVKNDDFIKNYFNHNRSDITLKRRISIMEDIVNLDLLAWNFINSIFEYNFTNFYLKGFLNKVDFEFNNKKNNWENLLKTYFDDILIYNKSNIKIYIEYKIRKEYLYICLYVTDNNISLDNNNIFKNLQNYTNFVVKNLNDINLIDFNKRDYFYIKILRDKNNKEKNIYSEEVEKISESIIKYLNDELIKEITSNNKFINFLNSFIPN